MNTGQCTIKRQERRTIEFNSDYILRKRDAKHNLRKTIQNLEGEYFYFGDGETVYFA